MPATIIDLLEDTSTSWMERIEFQYFGSSREHKALGNLPMHRFRFMRTISGHGLMRRLMELPKFLAFAWRLDAADDVPSSILGKASRRVRAAFRLPSRK